MSQLSQLVSYTDQEIAKFHEYNQLKPRLDQLLQNLAQSLDKQDQKLYQIQELRTLLNGVVNAYIYKISSQLDLDQTIKTLQHIKEKIGTLHSGTQAANGHSLGQEFEILVTEVISIKAQDIVQIQHKQQIDTQMRQLSLLIQQIYQQVVISSTVLMTYLDELILNSSSLLDSRQYQARFRKAVTQYMYEQQKFNLLREENEGFAKLIVELNQPNINQNTLQSVKMNVEALIGFFNLDPNRVLDITLDSFENNLWNHQIYIQLLKDFKSTNISQVIGFKFQNYYQQIQVTKNDKNGNQESYIPKDLFILTALLLKNNIITLEDIWPHLGTFQETKDELDEVENLINKQIKYAQFLYNQQFEAVTNREAYEASIKQRFLDQEEIEKLRSEMPFNFRLCLIESFVRINAWDYVDEILGRIYDYKLDLTMNKNLITSMCEAGHWFVDPIYSQLSKNKRLGIVQSKQYHYYVDEFPTEGSIRQAVNPQIFFEDLPKLIKCLNIYIAYDQSLFQKISIVIKHWAKENIKVSIQIAGEVLLPALSLLECNNQISQEVWDILSQAEATTRYDFYTQMLTQTYLQNISLTTSMVETYEAIKNWQRRLSIDTVKQNSRQLAKLASGNAVVVFNTILKQAMNYRNMIEAQIQSMQYCSQLSLDIVAYSLVRIVSDCIGERERLDAEANVAEWLQNLAEFAALFFKKYCQVDMNGLLTYLLNRMRFDNEYNEMIILKEVIAKMFGWTQFNINEMTSLQLQSLAGGFVLRLELMSQATQFKRNQKSGDALVSLFWDKTNERPLSLAFKLMANLARMTQYVLQSVDTKQMYLISQLFDRMQFIFIQFVETLSYLDNSPAKYMQLLPERVDRVLAINYRLPPAYIFFILRGSLKPIHFLTEDEFNQKVHEFKSIQDMHIDQRLEGVTPAKDEISLYWDEKSFLITRKDEIWKCLNPKLFTIFWYLQLQSLVVPEETYQEQIKKMQLNIEQLKAQGSNNRKNLKEMERLKQGYKNLQMELQEYQKNKAGVNEFLGKKLTECFESIEEENLINLSIVFIQYCLYPRLMFSASDALYSINFLKTLHAHRVPNFNILHTLSQILKCIVPCLHCCTEKESENLGIFFLELFALINHWSKPENWDKECQGYTGFAKMIGSNQSIRLQEFQQIAESIHKRFAQNLIVCFQNAKQSMKTQCGLKILNKLSPQFPNQFLIARVLQKHLQILVEQKQTIDNNLWTLAFSCNQNLQKKMNTMEKPPNVIEQERLQKEKEQKEQQRQNEREGRNKDERERERDRNQDKEKDKEEKNGEGARRKVKEREKEEQKQQQQSRNTTKENQALQKPLDPKATSNSQQKGNEGREGRGEGRNEVRENREGRDNRDIRDNRDNAKEGRKQSKSPTPKRRDNRRYSPNKDNDDKRYRDIKRVERDDQKRVERDDDITNRVIQKKDQGGRK